MSKKIIGYCQDDQREVLNNYAEANGYNLIRIFRDETTSKRETSEATKIEMFNFLQNNREIEGFLFINFAGQILLQAFSRNESGRLKRPIKRKDDLFVIPDWLDKFLLKIKELKKSFNKVN